MPLDDNVQVGLGETGGAVIATEYWHGNHYQIAKLAYGSNDDVQLVTATGVSGAPLPVRFYATNDGTPFDYETISSTTALQVNILGSVGATAIGVEIKNTGDYQGVTGTITITSGAGLAYWGLTGGDTIFIRGLSAGPSSGVLPSAAGASYDYVNIQGTTQGFPVRSAIWSNEVRPKAVGVSGAAGTTAASLLSYVTNVVGITVGAEGIGITIGNTGLQVTAGGPGANWGITVGAAVNVQSVNLDVRGLTAGPTFGAALATSAYDYVNVQGFTQGFPVRTMLVGGTGPYPPVGMSGDALKVAMVSSGITVNVDVTDTSFSIEGKTAAGVYTGHAVRVEGPSGGALPVWAVGTAGAGVLVAGTGGTPVVISPADGATALGITVGDAINVQATNLDVRGFTAGPKTGVYNSNYDYVTIQGLSAGNPVRSAIWSSEATPKAVGISGSAGTTSASLLSYITNTVGITTSSGGVGITGTMTITSGAGLAYYGITGDSIGKLRGLTAGPTSGAALATSAYDYVNVQGFTQGFPVRTMLVGGTGPYPPVGMSGDALKVAIMDSDVVVNVDVTDTTFMIQGLTAAGVYTGHAVRVVGASGGNLAVSGVAGATAMPVTGGGPGANWGITATNLNIRGLTYSDGAGAWRDYVGITGAQYTAQQDLLTAVSNTIGATLEDMHPLVSRDGFGLAKQSTMASVDSRITSYVTEKVASNTQLIKVAAGMSGSGESNTKEMIVRVVHTDQPTVLVNGQKGVGISAVQLSDNTNVLKSGLNIKAHQQNTGKIYVGNSSVTKDTESNGGYPLSAGEELFLECKAAEMVYAIGDVVGLTACFVAS